MGSWKEVLHVLFKIENKIRVKKVNYHHQFIIKHTFKHIYVYSTHSNTFEQPKLVLQKKYYIINTNKDKSNLEK